MVPIAPLAKCRVIDGGVDVPGLADARIDQHAPGGVDLGDLAAHQEAGHVEVVDGHVEEDPARDLDVFDAAAGPGRGW